MYSYLLLILIFFHETLTSFSIIIVHIYKKKLDWASNNVKLKDWYFVLDQV